MDSDIAEAPFDSADTPSSFSSFGWRLCQLVYRASRGIPACYLIDALRLDLTSYYISFRAVCTVACSLCLTPTLISTLERYSHAPRVRVKFCPTTVSCQRISFCDCRALKKRFRPVNARSDQGTARMAMAAFESYETVAHKDAAPVLVTTRLPHGNHSPRYMRRLRAEWYKTRKNSAENGEELSKG